MIGQTVAHYEILGKIGEGGMGVVYKARDNRLGRHVAIKVLPAHSVSNEEKKRRFITEARLASSLNHPNIITIYDIDSANGVDFIAMEFIAGKTLDQVIPRRGMRVPEALKLGQQIADALSRAHAAGIVHRDLKPTNVMVTDEGLVKVLDFGLAKLAEPAAADNAQTLPMQPCTEEGTILGTVAYMSPEQAEGKAIDARSDVFAFGSLFYEMVTGQRAFHGETRLSILSAILREEPRPVREVVLAVPREVERVITHCLRKEPAKRFQHMVDVKTLLEEIKEETESGRLSAAASPAAPARKRQGLLIGLAVLAVLGGAASWALNWRGMFREAAPRYTFSAFTFDSGLTTQPAISPDGKVVAYASDRGGGDDLDIWVQWIAGGDPIRLTKEPGHDCQPAFSPDSNVIAYTSFGPRPGVYVIPTPGGPARLRGPRGVWPSFSPDGKSIAYSVGSRWWRSSVYVVNTWTGEPQKLNVDVPWAYCPTWTPDGEHLLFEAVSEKVPNRLPDWFVAPAGGGHATGTGLQPLLDTRSMAFVRDLNPALDGRFVWSPDGKSVVLSVKRGDSTELLRAPVAPSTGMVTAGFEPLTSGPASTRHGTISRDGILACSQVSLNRQIWRLPLAADEGKVTGPLQLATTSGTDNVTPTVSADGKKLLYTSNRTQRGRVWTKDIASGEETLLTDVPGEEYWALFSPDRSKVAFTRGRSSTRDLYVTTITNRTEEKLCSDVNIAVDWFANGTGLLFQPMDAKVLRSIDIGSRQIRDVVKHASYAIRPGGLSRDGKWISFQLAVDEEHMPIIVAPLEGGVAAAESTWVQIAEGPNSMPWWSPNGGLIYYLSRSDGSYCLWAQRLDRLTKKPVGEPLEIQHFHGRRHVAGSFSFGYAMTADSLYCGLREVTSNIWLGRPE